MVMSFNLTKLAIDLDQLKTNNKIVLIVLCNYAHDTTHQAWPSFSTIAKKTGLSRASVVRAVNYLIAHNYVIRDKALGKSNVYIINNKKLSTGSITQTPVHTDTSITQTLSSITQTLVTSITQTPEYIINNKLIKKGEKQILEKQKAGKDELKEGVKKMKQALIKLC